MVGQIIVESVPIENSSGAGVENGTNTTQMEEKMLPSTSLPATISIIAISACARGLGGPHRGPRSGS